MKTIRNWEDLEPFGIIALTGEACGLGMRLLCDLTEAGVDLVKELFGIPGPLDQNMNSGAIASVLLPVSILRDLAAFALVKSGCVMAFHIKDRGVWGCESNEEIEQVREAVKGESLEIVRQYRPSGNCPPTGRAAHECFDPAV